MATDDQVRVCGVSTKMQNSPKLLFVACLAFPAIGSAQTVTAPEQPADSSQPLRVFKDAAPLSSGGWAGSIKSDGWWKPPVSGSEVPRWTIGHRAEFKTPGGLAFSGGFVGRRGDPLPLYLSHGSNDNAASTSVIAPGSRRLQWDAQFGVTAPMWTGPRLKINAVADLFVPLTRQHDSRDPSAPLLNSRAARIGVGIVF
jgi:hypothetical protein